MTKKIEGYAIKQYGRFLFEHKKFSSEYSKATLVVSDERVFTESEVRVMLDDIMGDDWRSISNPKTVAVSISRIVGIANTHGIVFDPA